MGTLIALSVIPTLCIGVDACINDALLGSNMSMKVICMRKEHFRDVGVGMMQPPLPIFAVSRHCVVRKIWHGALSLDDCTAQTNPIVVSDQR